MYHALLNRLKNHPLTLLADPVTRDWSVILGGTIIRMGLSFLTGILIVRTFGPEDFGVYSLLTAVAGIIGVVIDFGVTEAGVKRIAADWATARPNALPKAQVFFWLRVLLAGAGMGLGALLAGPVCRYLLNLPGQAWLFNLALLGVGATALSGSVNALLQATGRFGRISVALVASSALALGLAGLLALTGRLTPVTALVGINAGTALAGFWVGRGLLPPDWGRPGASPLGLPSKTTIQSETPALFRFGSWLWLANICKTLIAYLDFFLINLWLAPATVGIYALALGLAARAEVVNHSLYTVLIPMASALQDRTAMVAYLRQGFKRSVLISLPLLALMPLAVWFIPFFYGDEFRASVHLFQLLLAVVIFDIMTLPALLLIYTFDRPDLSALAEGLRVVMLIGLAVWLIPIMGPVGAIIAKFCAKLVGVIVTGVLLWRHYTRKA